MFKLAGLDSEIGAATNSCQAKGLRDGCSLLFGLNIVAGAWQLDRFKKTVDTHHCKG